MGEQSDGLTDMLSAVSSGDTKAWNRLLSIVYRELHTLAHEAMRQERPNHTLQTTALVHEVYLRLVKNERIQWQDRGHFFRAAAKAIRRILVDKARSRNAAKRGYGKGALSLQDLKRPPSDIDSTFDTFENLEALDKALRKLEQLDSNQRKCSVVELLFFIGMNIEQAAKVLGVSAVTVSRDWTFTRTWLRKEIMGGEVHGA